MLLVVKGKDFVFRVPGLVTSMFSRNKWQEEEEKQFLGVSETAPTQVFCVLRYGRLRTSAVIPDISNGSHLLSRPASGEQ